ncbi:MAG: maleylacetoacetate isomerase [Bdellovibrionota bacterium]
MELTLHHYWRSSCSWRVRWALQLKGIAYKSVAVNLLKGEQNDLVYLKLNPSGQVPCLLVDGRALSESTAILEWLEEAYPATPLLPKDPWVRAEVRSFSQMIACGIQPLANLKVQQFVSKEAEKKTEWSNHFVTEGLVPIETMLRKYSNEGKAFAFGPEPTMADLYLVPQVYNALRVNVDMTRFPLAKQVYDNALKTKACDAAAPHSQEGAQ